MPTAMTRTEPTRYILKCVATLYEDANQYGDVIKVKCACVRPVINEEDGQSVSELLSSLL